MDNYYIAHAKSIQHEVQMAIPHYKRFVVEAYGPDLAESIVKETMEWFTALLPQTPYIGGEDNHLTENLYLTVPMLAFYQAFKAHGKPVDEAARVIYKGTASMYTSFPFNVMLWVRGRRIFSQRVLDKLKQRAAASQNRRYPGDWVYETIPGDGKTFIFGVDYTECGILKYLTAQGAAELAPYLCWLDVPMCAAERVGLMRTKTLAAGDARCNFRFCRWGEQPEMKPDFLSD